MAKRFRHTPQQIFAGPLDIVRELRVGKRKSVFDMVSLMMLASDRIEELETWLKQAPTTD